MNFELLRAWLPSLAQHLWQSTIFGGVTALLVLRFRKSTARLRFGLWTAASLKWLVPFAALTALGSRVTWRPRAALPHASTALQALAAPFAGADSWVPAPAAAEPKLAHAWVFALVAIWLCGALAVLGLWILRWQQVAAITRAARPAAGRLAELPVRVGLTASPIEPGVFGVFRPVLLLPIALAECLSGPQLEAVVAHELCHVRRRDNLWAALHMLVEAVAWFHPLVWWIGARQIAERERACDEAVLRGGGDPNAYVEAILQVCRYPAGPALACVSGVGGADLKRRIAAIMTGGFGSRLNLRGKIALAGFGAAVLALPLAAGLLHPVLPVAAPAGMQSAARPRFDAISIKRDDVDNDSARPSWDVTPGGVTIRQMPLVVVIEQALDIRGPRLVGMPLWTRNTYFDIAARMPAGTTHAQYLLMLQSLLADRFQMVWHQDTKVLPVTVVEIAKGGPKLRPATGDCVKADFDGTVPDGRLRCGAVTPKMQGRGMLYQGRSVSMADFAAFFTHIGQSGENGVVDQTGLPGLFDFDLSVDNKPPDDLPHDDPNAFINYMHTAWAAAVKDQLGLIFNQDAPKKFPMPVIVIDRLAMPTPN